MKEYFENGIRVKEYSYDDWWEGVFNYWVGSLRHTVQVSESKEIYVAYLPSTEYDKILNKQKELYLQKVEDHFNSLVQMFEASFERSESKDELIKFEKDKYQRLLFDEFYSLPKVLIATERPFSDLPYSVFQISEIRRLYQELIVKGNKDYSHTPSPNCQIGIGSGDFHRIQVEAIAQYYNWICKYKHKEISYTIKNEVYMGREFEWATNEILSNGCVVINSMKIYTAKMAFCLITKELNVFNKRKQKDEQINGYQFLKYYEEGYNKGIEFFSSKYELPPSILYGSNAEAYVRDIHFNYFHRDFGDLFVGWADCKRTAPFILNNSTFFRYGYYSGIVSKVDEMIRQYPKLFEAFDKCDHDTIEEEIDFAQMPASLSPDLDKRIYGNENRTFHFIDDELSKMDATGWAYAFRDESDYRTFVALLVDYFEHKPYVPPLQKISIKKGSKTRFAKSLRPIHKELSEVSLKSDIQFYAILRVIVQLEGHTNDELYQAITR